MKKIFKLHYFVHCIVAIVYCKPSKAGIDPPVIKVLDGNLQQIKVDSFAMVEDAKFFDPSYNSQVSETIQGSKSL
jgi:hypothetical protein